MKAKEFNETIPKLRQGYEIKRTKTGYTLLDEKKNPLMSGYPLTLFITILPLYA